MSRNRRAVFHPFSDSTLTADPTPIVNEKNDPPSNVSSVSKGIQSDPIEEQKEATPSSPPSSPPTLPRRRSLLPPPISSSSSSSSTSPSSPSPSAYKVLQVSIPADPSSADSVPSIVSVEFVPSTAPPPRLGGFRHRVTGAIYPHRSTQTEQKKKDTHVERKTRATQTVDVTNRVQQTMRDAETQMERPDLFATVSPMYPSYPRVITPSSVPITAVEVDSQRDQNAFAIQMFLRQSIAIHLVATMRAARHVAERKRLQMEEEEELRKREKYLRAVEKRMNPRSKGDFDILMRELQAWRDKETKKIKERYLTLRDGQQFVSQSDRESMESDLRELLFKEVKILQTIDRLKVTAMKENERAAIQGLLEKVASPYVMKSTEGHNVEISTPQSRRAKYLVELYQGLSVPHMDTASRMTLLNEIRDEISQFDSPLTRDILILIQREEEMVERHRPLSTYEGLRRRLLHQFLQWIEYPVFNPRVSEFRVDHRVEKWDHIVKLEETVRRRQQEEKMKEVRKLKENPNKKVVEVVDEEGGKRKEVVWRPSRYVSNSRKDRGKGKMEEKRLEIEEEKKEVAKVVRDEEEEDDVEAAMVKNAAAALSSSGRAASVGPLVDSSAAINSLDDEGDGDIDGEV